MLSCGLDYQVRGPGDVQVAVIRGRAEWNVPGEGPQLHPGSCYPQTAVLINLINFNLFI